MVLTMGLKLSTFLTTTLVIWVGFQVKTFGTTEISNSPKIVDFVDRLNHPEGTSATFTCSIGSGELSDLKFEWFKDDQKIVSSNAKYKITILPENYNSILRIADLKPQDSATYSCLAKNPYGQDKISTQLFVKVQLKWIEAPPSEVEARVGESLQVPCKAGGQPPALIEWHRLRSQDLESSSNDSYLGGELSFNSLKPNDTGIYECRAKNGIEKDLVARLSLKVLGK